jgi:hypothetical protein
MNAAYYAHDISRSTEMHYLDFRSHYTADHLAVTWPHIYIVLQPEAATYAACCRVRTTTNQLMFTAPSATAFLAATLQVVPGYMFHVRRHRLLRRLLTELLQQLRQQQGAHSAIPLTAVERAMSQPPFCPLAIYALVRHSCCCCIVCMCVVLVFSTVP